MHRLGQHREFLLKVWLQKGIGLSRRVLDQSIERRMR